MLPIAVDAMGGDRAPAEIVGGARRAAEERGIPVVLVGHPEELGDIGALEVIPASEVIQMDSDPVSSVRKMKDSSVVRAAEAVRDGVASAMVTAGNTGAAMASALLRMGRIAGVSRPAIATLLPAPGATPTVLLDAGANSECSPEWLVQFGRMGAVLARDRLEVENPRIALLSIGEEPGKGSPFAKDAHTHLQAAVFDRAQFIGNVEGRDLLTDAADVVVTDGFTGNVALKTLEGAMKTLMTALLVAISTRPEAVIASKELEPEFEKLYTEFHPDTYGGAMLLGVRGVCVISHGSSNALAIENAVRWAAEMVTSDMVDHLTVSMEIEG